MLEKTVETIGFIVIIFTLPPPSLRLCAQLSSEVFIVLVKLE